MVGGQRVQSNLLRKLLPIIMHTSTKLVFLVIVVLQLVWFEIVAKPFKWVDLTQQELESWYSPTDLCLLNRTDKFGYPQELRKNECFNVSRGNRRIHCSVGMGNNNNPCFGPFGNGRPHFKMGVEGYTDATSTPLINAFSHFIETNTTLVFLGDSTTRQKLQALECEVHREDHKIRTAGNIFGILPCNTKYYITLPDKRSLYIRIVSIGPNSANCLKGGRNKEAIAKGVFENAAYIIDRENNVYNRSVFVVANMGLWYNDETEYSAVVPHLLKWLQQVSTFTYPSNLNTQHFNNSSVLEENDADLSGMLLNNAHNIGSHLPSSHNVAKHAKRKKLRNTVVWHETFSQHWANPWGSGYFAKPQVEAQVEGWKEHAGNYSKLSTEYFVSPFCCRAVTNTSHMADWRNDIVNGLLKSPDKRYKDIKIFPMAEITR